MYLTYHQMYRIVIFLLLLCFLHYGPVSYAQEGFAVNNIDFSGNRNFSGTELRDQISTYTISDFERYFLFKNRFEYSENIIKSDINALTNFYQQEGFLAVQIAYDLIDIDYDARSLDIIIHIEEGEYIVVDSVEYVVTSGSASIDSLLAGVSSKLRINSGERFRDKSLNADRNMLLQQFLNSGYPYSTVEYALDLLPGDKKVNILWLVDTGPESYIGEIFISGAGNISEDFILKKLEFSMGDLYRQVLLDTSHKDIYSLGLYQSVVVKAVLDEERSPQIPVQIILRPAPEITTRFGAGFGSEEKIRLFGEIFKLSFLGGARRLNLYIRHSSLEPYRIDLQFTQPAFIFPEMDFILNPFLRKQDEPGFKVSRLGIRTTFLHPILERVNSSLSYTYEEVDQDTVDLIFDDIYYSDDYKGLYNKSMINLGLSWNNSYPVFYPEHGFMSFLNIQYNGFIARIDYPFQKILLDMRKYQSINKLVLALRMKIGGIEAIGGNEFIPVEERFYAGGSYSVRGWARSELGPKDDQNRPLGGNSILELSSELRFPLYDPVYAVAFLDAGNVWLTSYSYKLNDLRYSVGTGIRFRTPIGPVRLDAAIPVFDEEDKVQFHFSIGHAF